MKMTVHDQQASTAVVYMSASIEGETSRWLSWKAKVENQVMYSVRATMDLAMDGGTMYVYVCGCLYGLLWECSRISGLDAPSGPL
jgi:hypothetical protein